MAARREEKQISEVWVQILYHLHIIPTGLTTEKLAKIVGQPKEQTGRDLASMRKKGLVKATRRSNRIVWYIDKPQGEQEGLWGETKAPNQKGLRQIVGKARKRKGTDASNWQSLTLGQKAFESTVSSGCLVNWDRANEIVQDFHGSPSDLRQRLEGGNGATVTWLCGCELTITWKGDERLKNCRGIICDRLVELARAKKLTAEQKKTLIEQVKSSKKPIAWSRCFVLFKAPKGLKIGALYQVTCKCYACVSLVTGIPGQPDDLMGVIADDRGLIVCDAHKQSVKASRA